MSLRIAQSIATSALTANSTAASVVSENVANASTAGYTRKLANYDSTSTGNGTNSVQIGSISSNVDQFLLKSVVLSQSDLGKAQSDDNYLDQVQQALGTVDSTTGITAAINNLETATTSLASDPSSASDKATIVSNLQTVAAKFQTLSGTIQTTRQSADKNIATTVDTINKTLNQLDDLNTSITLAKARGQDVGDQEDQRGELLKTLSTNIDINYSVDSTTDAVKVWTGSGTSLLDSSVHELSYTPAGSVSSQTTYSTDSTTSGFDAIKVSGTDITQTVRSGTLKSLIDIRDTTLPQQQAALDNLASTMITKINDVNNEGTPTPPPDTMTGTKTVTASDSFSGTGTLRVSVMDASGVLQEYKDIDLSTMSNVQDVLNTINSMSGVSADINSDGKLELTGGADPTTTDSTNKYRIGLSGTDEDVGSNDQSFSAYFGMNDLLTGTTASDIKVNSAVSDNTALVASSVTSTSATVGQTALTVSEGTAATDLSDLFKSSTSFAAAGPLSARKETFSDYAGDLVQSVATTASNASDTYSNQKDYTSSLETTFSSNSGVNLDEETAALSSIQSAYQAAAAVLKTMQSMFSSALSMMG